MIVAFLLTNVVAPIVVIVIFVGWLALITHGDLWGKNQDEKKE